MSQAIENGWQFFGAALLILIVLLVLPGLVMRAGGGWHGRSVQRGSRVRLANTVVSGRRESVVQRAGTALQQLLGGRQGKPVRAANRPSSRIKLK